MNIHIENKIRSNSFINSYSQFIIDLPRLTLYLDGNLSNMSPEEVVNYLFDNLRDNNQVKFCIYFLTQTSLADYYITEYKKIKNIDEHLVCDGSYIVKIDTKIKTINISKNFRKIFSEDDLSFELDFADLIINHDLESKVTCHIWEYQFTKDVIDNCFVIID